MRLPCCEHCFFSGIVIHYAMSIFTLFQIDGMHLSRKGDPLVMNSFRKIDKYRVIRVLAVIGCTLLNVLLYYVMRSDESEGRRHGGTLGSQSEGRGCTETQQFQPAIRRSQHLQPHRPRSGKSPRDSGLDVYPKALFNLAHYEHAF